MNFYQYPEWSSTIRTHYWHLRFARGFDVARIRKQYRLIEKEKKRLQNAGVDQELVRLLCRHMANTRNQKAEQRFWNAHLQGTHGLKYTGIEGNKWDGLGLTGTSR